jgi:hypothetical protein
MLRRIRHQLTYANVIGTLALFVALGGGAYAVTAAKNSVKSSSIKDGQVKSEDVADDGLTGTDINESTLVGVTGPPGKDGTNGTDGTSSTAPTGAVMFFNLATCPSGWTELTAGRGRYLVGRPSGGTLAGTAGTALTNLENRPVGQHSHTITDPQHFHTFTMPWGDANPVSNQLGMTRVDSVGGSPGFVTDNKASGITVNNAGSVAGTNAPYIQLLVCQKT